MPEESGRIVLILHIHACEVPYAARACRHAVAASGMCVACVDAHEITDSESEARRNQVRHEVIAAEKFELRQILLAV